MERSVGKGDLSSRHLGLDLGGTNIKRALIESADGGYQNLWTDKRDTGAEGGPEVVARNMIHAAAEVLDDDVSISTVGVGVPGLFDANTGQIKLFPNLPGAWNGFPLRDRMESALGRSVWMINDARAFTLAEGLIGAGAGCHTVVCLTLGTGIGGGIMIEGRLHLGAFGVAGEIGHQTIEPDGPLCGCGNRGCMEPLTQAAALAELAGRATAEEVFEAATAGDERSLAAIQQVARYLGIGLANMVAVLGPERIIIGGGISDAGELLLGPIREAVRERVTLVPTEKIEVVVAALGSSAGALGAALAGAIKP